MAIELTLEEKIEALNLRQVVEDLDVCFNNARYVAPYPEYAGMARNDIVKTVVEYFNGTCNKDTYDKEFNVEYKERDW